MMERQAEAVTELKRAIRLDPHVSVIRWGLAFVYWCGRRYEEAIQELGQSLASELCPGTFLAWTLLFSRWIV